MTASQQPTFDSEAWATEAHIVTMASALGIPSGAASMAPKLLEPVVVDDRSLYRRGEVNLLFRRPLAELRAELQRLYLASQMPTSIGRNGGAPSGPSRTESLYVSGREAAAILDGLGVSPEKVSAFRGNSPSSHRYKREDVFRYAQKHGSRVAQHQLTPVAAPADCPPEALASRGPAAPKPAQTRKSAMSEQRWNVLHALWDAGGCIRAGDTAAELVLHGVQRYQSAVTMSGVKQHLWKLENAGVIRAERLAPRTAATGYKLTDLGVKQASERFGPLPEAAAGGDPPPVEPEAPAAEQPKPCPDGPPPGTEELGDEEVAEPEAKPVTEPVMEPVEEPVAADPVAAAPPQEPQSLEEAVIEASKGTYRLDADFIRAVMAMNQIDRRTLLHAISIIDSHAGSATWDALPHGTRAHIILEMVKSRMQGR